MERVIYDQLQLRELFHLEFLRWFGRKIKATFYALKGGVNLRFFFNSPRYSEDMDLDIYGIRVNLLKDEVMKILESASFGDTLKPFGVDSLVPPDITKAKQTETTQRFKVHLLTSAGEDLFTKIEFSRRGFKGEVVVETVSSAILREYRLSPLLISHYDIRSAISQKIEALAARTVIQARDIFDLYALSTQCKPIEVKEAKISRAKLKIAHEKVFEVGFEQFRDTVISYLSGEEQTRYNSPPLWDEVRVKAADFIEEMQS